MPFLRGRPRQSPATVKDESSSDHNGCLDNDEDDDTGDEQSSS
jgi:hypothetical protein